MSFPPLKYKLSKDAEGLKVSCISSITESQEWSFHMRNYAVQVSTTWKELYIKLSGLHQRKLWYEKAQNILVNIHSGNYKSQN